MALSCAAAALIVPLSGWAAETDAKVDAIFSAFTSETPGCAVGVEKDGQTLISRGYGMADLEHKIPLSPDSVFYMASVSKQFAAFSIMLLVEDGKLKLTDSVRKFYPELPEFMNPITVENLLNHTSGVRDYLALTTIMGNPNEYTFTDEGVLRLLDRQKALNFAPGSDWSYSNSGYVLLSLIAKKAAGKSLNDFAQERVFGPLGMKSTRFQHDHTALVPNKAFGYEKKDGTWHTNNVVLDVVADGGLYSSITDMMNWVKNFDAPKIGAEGLVKMRTTKPAGNGRDPKYGFGLMTGTHHDLDIVQHSGGMGGYRTHVVWFPSQKLAAVTLCNAGNGANSVELAMKAADIFLPAWTEPKKDEPKPATISEVARQARVGLYRNAADGYLAVKEKDGKLAIEGGSELVALDDHRFAFARNPKTILTFGKEGPSATVEMQGANGPAALYKRVTPISYDDAAQAQFVGAYMSPELEATYHIIKKADGLYVEVGGNPDLHLISSGPRDFMRLEQAPIEFVFKRDAKGKVTGFELNFRGGHGLVFQRV